MIKLLIAVLGAVVAGNAAGEYSRAYLDANVHTALEAPTLPSPPFVAPEFSTQPALTFYVNPAVTCSDTPSGGSEALPYCTVTYAKGVANPGDTFLIAAGIYDEGAMTFSRNGTSVAPIAYRAVGDVAFGYHVVDEDFVAEPGLANVYSIAWSLAAPGQVSQLRFPGILVEDPNTVSFTMEQAEGPMRLSPVTTDAALTANEGTWRFTGGRLYVHAYGNRTPSTADTDFVVGIGGAVALTVTANWQVFEGFKILYTFNTGGSNNLYKNLKFQGQQFALTGSNNRGENVSVTHVIVRDQSNWTWHLSATGTAMTVTGSGHVLKGITLFKNWNSTMSTDAAPGIVIDGFITRSAPNHCGPGALSQPGTVLRNFISYNCQDHVWLSDTSGVVIEHATIPSGIGIEGFARPLGPITIRNSIFSGSVWYIRGPDSYCTWEAGSLMENNVISTTATIERCGPSPMQEVPILTYIDRCNSGFYPAGTCMTIRNNRFVDPSAWNTVVAQSLITSFSDTWNATLVPNSPAIDLGIVSGTLTDINGVARGANPDAGVYEGIGLPVRPRMRMRMRMRGVP